MSDFVNILFIKVESPVGQQCIPEHSKAVGLVFFPEDLSRSKMQRLMHLTLEVTSPLLILSCEQSWAAASLSPGHQGCCRARSASHPPGGVLGQPPLGTRPMEEGFAFLTQMDWFAREKQVISSACLGLIFN